MTDAGARVGEVYRLLSVAAAAMDAERQQRARDWSTTATGRDRVVTDMSNDDV